MKNLKKWTRADVEKAMKGITLPEECDWKDAQGYAYDALEEYAYTNFISMKGVPDGWSCPRSFMEWQPEE